MKRASCIFACITVLLAGGCAKRPVSARIVFAPSTTAPGSATATEAAGALVLAEPQAPDVDPEPAPPNPEPPDKPREKPRVRLAPPDPSIEPEPETPPMVEVPTLEPREGPAAQAAQRRQVTQFQDQIRTRITRQEGPRLSSDEHRMLTDARTFLAQSERALAANDFQRALTLAHKASMLLAVIEQQ